MALYSLKCADVPLRNCSLTHLWHRAVSLRQHGFLVDVLTVSLLLKDQSIICANSSSKETGEFWGTRRIVSSAYFKASRNNNNKLWRKQSTQSTTLKCSHDNCIDDSIQFPEKNGTFKSLVIRSFASIRFDLHLRQPQRVEEAGPVEPYHTFSPQLVRASQVKTVQVGLVTSSESTIPPATTVRRGTHWPQMISDVLVISAELRW